MNKLENNLIIDVESLGEDVIDNAIPPQDIFAFNESRSCADLKRMYDKAQIDISPDFQRERVWKQPAKTRFLDSLLKNLPIPSMCVSLDIKTNKRIVIDGLQRISTIVEFLQAIEKDDISYTLSTLDDVDDRLSGRNARQIKEQFPEIIEAIENVSIPVTTLRCDLEKENHMQYIFTIFHRLNTGGTKLNNQEIRNCIFNGSFNNLLFECSKENEKELRSLLGSDNTRFAYEEFVLRFFAFQDCLNIYKGKLASFLNNYMEDNKDIKDSSILDLKKKLFHRVVSLVSSKMYTQSVTSKIVLEAIFYGVGKNIDNLELDSPELLNKRYHLLMASKEFSASELQSGLLQKAKVESRLKMAQEVFK